MPTQYYIIAGVCFAVMAFSAFYLGDENRNTRGFARAGLVIGAGGLFVSTMTYGAIFLAVLIVLLPVFLIVAWWNGAF